MKRIKLAEPWTYRTPIKTIDYKAGEHIVSNEIGKSAEHAGHAVSEPEAKESKHGRRPPKNRQADPAAAAEG